MSRPKPSKTIGRVNTPAAVAVAREDQASKIYHAGLDALNRIVTCGLPAEERAEVLARLAAFAQSRLEQVLGEIPPTLPSKEDLAFLD